jgi:hypothetical protein
MVGTIGLVVLTANRGFTQYAKPTNKGNETTNQNANTNPINHTDPFRSFKLRKAKSE